MDWNHSKKYFDKLYDSEQLKIIKRIYDGNGSDFEIIAKDPKIFNKEIFDKITFAIIASPTIRVSYWNSHVNKYVTEISDLEPIISFFLTNEDILIESKNIIISPYEISLTYNLIKRSIDQKIKLDYSILKQCMKLNGYNMQDRFYISEIIKLLVNQGDKPTEELLIDVCACCDESIIRSVLERGIEPNLEAFVSLVDSSFKVNINILFDYGLQFQNWKEMFALVEDKSHYLFRLKHLDISKGIKNIDKDCLMNCYQYGIDVPPSMHENNKADIDCLRAACKGDNLTLAKTMVKKYGLKFDSTCLENACLNGNRQFIKFLTEKCNIPLTDKCLVNYMRKIKKTQYVQKLFDLRDEKIEINNQ